MGKEKKTQKKVSKKYRGMTGYKLHRQRLQYTGMEAIRTMKYPLGQYDKQSKKIVLNDFQRELCERIKHDYEKQTGQINPDALVNGRGEYCLYNLYLDYLRAGMIFGSSVAKLKYFVNFEKYNCSIEKSMRQKDDKFFNLIDMEQFMERIGTTVLVKSRKSEQELKNFFYGKKSEIEESLSKNESLDGKTGIFRSDIYQDKEKQIDEYTKKIIEGIGLPDGNGKTKSNKKPDYEQNDFWLQNFGLEVIQGDTEEGALFLDPELGLLQDRYQEQDLFDRLQDKDQWLKLAGIEGKYNAFSFAFNFFFQQLLEGDKDKIKQTVTALDTERWRGREDDLHKRVDFLIKQAKKLGEPKIASNWADYRSNFGGKLKSWLTNSENQVEKIKQKLFGYFDEEKQKYIPGHSTDLKKLQKTLIEIEDVKENNFTRQFIQKIDEIIEINTNLETNFSAEYLSLYEQLLAEIRTDLNKYIQNQNPDLEEKELEKKRNQYKSIFATLPQMPDFPGKGKKQRLEKMLNAREIVEAGVKGVMGLQEILAGLELKDISDSEISIEEEKDRHRLLKRFDTLHQVYQRAEHSPFVQQIIQREVKKATGVNIKEMFSNQLFSAYRRKGKDWEEVKTRDVKEVFESLPILVEDLKIDFDKNRMQLCKKEKDVTLYLDALELERVRVGIITYFFKDINVSAAHLKSIFQQEYFEDLHRYIDLLKLTNLKSPQLERVLTRYVFPEVKGMLNVLSKDSFTERYVVQMMASEKEYPLIYHPGHQQFYLCEKKYLENEDSDYYKLSKKKISSKENLKPVTFDSECLLPIQSSKYQLQFLRESLSSVSGSFAKKFDITAGEYSLITERDYNIDFFSDDLQAIEENDRLFVSIPFTLTPKLPYKKDAKKLKKKLDDRIRYLGIDVGEKGLGLALLDCSDNERVRLLQSWFLSDPGISKIRDYYSQNQKRQRTGTFTQANTDLANIRKDVAHKLRSRIHDIAVRYNAIPSYEFNISNFETKSGRLTTLYRTVKTSDASTDNKSKAEKAQRNHTWGTKTPMGIHRSAYGTSYTCTKCWRCIYNLKDQVEKQKECVFERIQGDKTPYGVITLENGTKLYGYIGYDKSKLTGKEAFTKIKDFVRPPVFDMKKTKGQVESLFEDKDWKENQKKQIIATISHFLSRTSCIGPKEKKKIRYEIAKKIRDFELKKSDNVLKSVWKKIKEIESICISDKFFENHPFFTPERKEGYSKEDKHWRKFYRQSLNSAIFVCPFVGCEHISDADVQAAALIGLRAWYKTKIDTSKPKDDSGMLAELEYYKKQGLPPVELHVPRKSWNDVIEGER